MDKIETQEKKYADNKKTREGLMPLLLFVWEIPNQSLEKPASSIRSCFSFVRA
jgi:hypothetical protein